MKFAADPAEANVAFWRGFLTGTGLCDTDVIARALGPGHVRWIGARI
jgi:hypothetical protein